MVYCKPNKLFYAQERYWFKLFERREIECGVSVHVKIYEGLIYI